MPATLGILSFLVVLVPTIFYVRDVLCRRVVPARSTRFMFVLLMGLALGQQIQLGSGWALALTAGDLAGALVLLPLVFHYGTGGLQLTDRVCYLLLAVD